MASFFDFFPTPKFLEMPAPGLSLSDGAVRLIEFTHGKNGLVIQQADIFHFPMQLISAGDIKNPQELIKILDDFRKKNNLHYVRASLPEERAYLFSTVVPSVAGEDLRASVEFTIEENVPLSVSEAIFDYTVVGSEQYQGRPGYKVSVSVLPEKVVTEYLNIFRSAGLEPLHFEIESQAIIKAVVPKGDKTVSLVVNLSSGKAGFYISDGGAVSFTSTIITTPFGNDALKETNLAYEDKPAEEAKNIIATKPAPNSQALKEIVDEIKKVFLYWNTQADKKDEKLRPIERIIIVGEEGGRRGVPEALSQEFGIPAEVANVWQNAFSLGDYIPEISKNDSLGYVTSVGLALTHPQ
jgi:Tfp pilus assembly PilM family ATPase